ncbi:MAG: PKD domain-containing protein [Candidatus Paceibacterota bacterium]
MATPGQQNKSSKSEVVEVAETPENDTEQTSVPINKTVSKSSSDTVFFKDLDSKLILKPDIKTVAYVNQKIPFKVEASGLGRDLLASLVYTWNFGDSFEAYGKETQHSYSYPGKYVVTLHGKVAENEAIVKAEIMVLPVTFSISRNDQGDVQINNNAPYDIDISGYKLIGAKTVVMPARTIMLAKGTVTIDRERLELGNRPSQIYLYDSSLHLVASDLPSGESKAELSVSSESRSLPLPVSSHTASQSKTNFTFATTTETLETTDNPVLPPEEFVGTESNVIEKEPTKSKDIQWPYALFIALLLGAFTVIIYSKN